MVRSETHANKSSTCAFDCYTAATTVTITTRRLACVPGWQLSSTVSNSALRHAFVCYTKEYAQTSTCSNYKRTQRSMLEDYRLSIIRTREEVTRARQKYMLSGDAQAYISLDNYIKSYLETTGRTESVCFFSSVTWMFLSSRLARF